MNHDAVGFISRFIPRSIPATHIAHITAIDAVKDRSDADVGAMHIAIFGAELTAAIPTFKALVILRHFVVTRLHVMAVTATAQRVTEAARLASQLLRVVPQRTMDAGMAQFASHLITAVFEVTGLPDQAAVIGRGRAGKRQQSEKQSQCCGDAYRSFH